MVELNRKDSKERGQLLQEIQLIDVNPKDAYTHPLNDDNQRILLVADVVICSIVIPFLVVASWRGTWQLIDMYRMYFPLWKTLLVSYLSHATFALSQNVIHEVLITDYKDNQGLIKTVQFSLRIMYLFVFYFTGVAQWASLWSICDIYSKGIALDILLTMISILFLALLGGIYNVCSTPMAFVIDSREETFLFNIRYFSKLLFLTIILTKRIVGENPSSETENRIFQAPPLNENNAQTSVHPKPFKIEYRGPIPRKFSPTSTTTTSTTKRPTTLIYPQLTNYRNRYYPKNIQEIVRHMTNKPTHQTQEYTRNTGKRHASNVEEYSNNIVNDIFHQYKPNDPSEVNLLATSRVRFAPPAWKDFRNTEDERNRPQSQFIPKITQIPNQPYNTIPLNSSFAENVPILLTNENRVTNENDMTKVMKHFMNFRESVKTPMTITLNLFPMETGYDTKNSPRSRFPFFSQEEPKSSLSKMTINLRVFPEYSNVNEHIGNK